MGVLFDSLKIASLNKVDRWVDFKKLLDESYTKRENQGFSLDNSGNSNTSNAS
ncbi:hypothetical protein [Paenibacillus roseipurpureus]|uniref:Uncharacterized protein n=1 Tax=Paenibacillus roseopurpureus TaxID=2918901 RepID=A0AA96LWY2_9BACL|nr:hypothetical protein [Paenibacillus sp. MBLB1832]WNR46180.1 hypothetical protein MJB10_08825 [Paenibacillus sp. MBLB1832]